MKCESMQIIFYITVISGCLPAQLINRTGWLLHRVKKKSTDYLHWWITCMLCYSTLWWRKRDIKVIHFSLLKVVWSNFWKLESFFVKFSSYPWSFWDEFKSNSNEFNLDLLPVPLRADGHFAPLTRKKFFRARVAYFTNHTASFNPVEVTLVRSGDVHPQPGPVKHTDSSQERHVNLAHINARPIKNRNHFILIKEVVLAKKIWYPMCQRVLAGQLHIWHRARYSWLQYLSPWPYKQTRRRRLYLRKTKPEGRMSATPIIYRKLRPPPAVA